MTKAELIRRELSAFGYQVEEIWYESSFGYLPWGGWYINIDKQEFYLGKTYDDAILSVKAKNLKPVED